MSEHEPTKAIADDLALRARQAEDISAMEYRRLFIKGLAALLREVDSISFILRKGGRGC